MLWTKKRRYKEPQDPTDPIHQAEDQNNYLNYHLSDSHKMTKAMKDLHDEGAFPEEEASREEEAFPEAEDTQEEEECHLEDHQEVVGDHHHCQ